MRSRTKFIAQVGILTAVAAVFSYIEAIIPIPLGVPGIKLGLANVVIVFSLYNMGLGLAVTISMVRIILVSAMFGSPVMALYSIAGALVSLIAMAALKHSRRFSIIGVSMAGGVLHNAAQLAVAVAVSGTPAIFGYMPVLIIAGMITGVLIGVITTAATRHIAVIAPR